jgi:hypothetical protein
VRRRGRRGGQVATPPLYATRAGRPSPESLGDNTGRSPTDTDSAPAGDGRTTGPSLLSTPIRCRAAEWGRDLSRPRYASFRPRAGRRTGRRGPGVGWVAPAAVIAAAGDGPRLPDEDSALGDHLLAPIAERHQFRRGIGRVRLGSRLVHAAAAQSWAMNIHARFGPAEIRGGRSTAPGNRGVGRGGRLKAAVPATDGGCDQTPRDDAGAGAGGQPPPARFVMRAAARSAAGIGKGTSR